MQTAPAEPKRKLTRTRVRRVLLAGKPYAGFILEESGFRPAGVVNPIDAPIFDIATSGKAALDELARGDYQLLLADLDLPDMTGSELAARVRERFPAVTPMVFTDNSDLGGPGEEGEEREPNFFINYGAPGFWRSLVRLAEDERNAPLHLADGTALAILLVEDEPNFYSHFLPTLYERIRSSAIELLPPDRRPRSDWGVSENRPLVLLRRNFEDACEALMAYQGRILALITDLRFPVAGELRDDAGLRLLYRARALSGHLSAAVHSRDQQARGAVEAADAKFLWKDSPLLLSEIDNFLMHYCGFGPFVFRHPAGDVVGEARTLRQLRDLIAEVPDLVFEHHGLHDDFSAWLAVHGFSRLARGVRDLHLIEPDLRGRVLALLDEELARQPDTP